jgi:hypothetical protein
MMRKKLAFEPRLQPRNEDHLCSTEIIFISMAAVWLAVGPCYNEETQVSRKS